MEKELILLLILGGLAALDMTEAWQTMLSQALVSAALVGWIMGDLKAGIQIGIFLQLLYFWVVPMGVALFPDTSLGGIFGAITFITLQKNFALESDKIIFITLISALAFSIFCEKLLIFHRKNNFRWVRWVEKNLEKNQFVISLAVVGELLSSFLRGAVLTGIGILLCHYLVLPVMQHLDFIPNNYFAWCEWGLVGFGLATAFNYFGKRKNLIWLGLGIITGILIILL